MAVAEKAEIRRLVESLIPVYSSMSASISESLSILRRLALALGVPPEEVVPPVVPQYVYELYDLVEEVKLTVKTTPDYHEITNKDFKVLLATAENADVQVDFSPITDDSYKVLRGSTYVMTRKERAVEKLYFKGSASGTLWVTIWR
jgi:hypothetical protein